MANTSNTLLASLLATFLLCQVGTRAYSLGAGGCAEREVAALRVAVGGEEYSLPQFECVACGNECVQLLSAVGSALWKRGCVAVQ